MLGANQPDNRQRVLDSGALQGLIELLREKGYRVIGPRIVDGAIVLGAITGICDLPEGITDEQEPARYRLRPGTPQTLFGYAAPAQGWKRFLFPPEERLWQAVRRDDGFCVEDVPPAIEHTALFGVRPCDLRAIAILDHVFMRSGALDPRYQARRAATFIIALECTRAGGTCFCASMGAGPDIADDGASGADIILTEFMAGDAPVLLARPAGRLGAEMLARLPSRHATTEEREAAAAALQATAAAMQRQMVPDVAALIRRTLDHSHWADVAARCLACGNCTMVCPTCFCSTMADTSDLTGAVAERHRRWDSCFTLDFSNLHGGPIRHSKAARYRQWLAHKLAHWWQQFGCSGCVGCGRCITWCPVGIDITEEARALQD